jgi:hypothetical protein
MGQTERSLYHRYKEHYQNFKTGNNTPNFARHLIQNNYSIDRTENIINAVHVYIQGGGGHMNTLQQITLITLQVIII